MHIFLSVRISWFCICKYLTTELFLYSLYIFNLYALQCKQPHPQNGSIANFRIPVSFGGRCSPAKVVDTDVIIVVVHREFRVGNFHVWQFMFVLSVGINFGLESFVLTRLFPSQFQGSFQAMAKIFLVYKIIISHSISNTLCFDYEIYQTNKWSYPSQSKPPSTCVFELIFRSKE